MPLPRWRKVPEPHQGEDPASLFLRLAADQLLSPQAFYRLYFITMSNPLPNIGERPEILSKIVELTGYDEELIASLSWKRLGGGIVRFRGLDLPTTWLSSRRRIAPGVLANDGSTPYARLAWRFPALPVDLETGEWLTERCPECSRALTWMHSDHVHQCQACEHDLRCTPPVITNPEVVVAARMLASTIGLYEGEGISVPEPFSGPLLAHGLLFIEWCAWFSGLTRMDGTTKTPENAHLGVDAARSWPEALEQAADLLFRQEPRQVRHTRLLQESLHRMPTPEMKKHALRQLASIISESDYQYADRWWSSARDRKFMYFRTGYKRT